MQTATADSTIRKSPARNDLPDAATNAQMLALKLIALRTAVRRQPQVAAGVIAYWLGKESN